MNIINHVIYASLDNQRKIAPKDRSNFVKKNPNEKNDILSSINP